MSQAGGVTSRASARIRGFSVLVSVIGVIFVALIAWVTFSADDGRAIPNGIDTSRDHYYPWENQAAAPATRDGDTWTGRGQQFIELTGLTPGEPLLMTIEAESSVSAVFLSDSADLAGARDLPEFSSYGTDPLYLISRGEQATVWLRMRTADPWTARIVPAGLESRAGVVSGTGSGVFLYTGSASSARVSTRSDYTVRVDVVTVHGIDQQRLSDPNGAQTIAWRDSDSTVFIVDSVGDAASWAFEFFEPAQTDPLPTDPLPTGDADE